MSSAMIAAASAGFAPSGRSARLSTRINSIPAASLARSSSAASAGSSAAKTSTAWVTGRARARSARSRAPSKRACQSAERRLGSGDGKVALEALAVGEDQGIAPDRNRDLGQLTACIDPDRRTRRIGIGGGAVGFLDLKEFHVSGRPIAAPFAASRRHHRETDRR